MGGAVRTAFGGGKGEGEKGSPRRSPPEGEVRRVKYTSEELRRAE